MSSLSRRCLLLLCCLVVPGCPKFQKHPTTLAPDRYYVKLGTERVYVRDLGRGDPLEQLVASVPRSDSVYYLTRTLADRIPEPDTPMAAASAARFELQVGAYLGHQLAVDQRDALDLMGFPTAVHSEKRQETIWHRVIVRPYS